MKATLVSWTQDPIGTVLKVWEASKTETPLGDIIASVDGEQTELGSRGESGRALFQRVVDQQIPVAQFVQFNFVLEDVPVAWREQAVRHRIGVKYGDNYAVDIVPEADISFWSQSMRIQSMGNFADEGKFHTPETVLEIENGYKEHEAAAIYLGAMRGIQDAYNELVALGVPMEDARNLIPLGATHRIAMNVNLQALKHIIGERGCWILQGSLWEPVIKSMVDELATKVDPMFRRLVDPPCVDGGCFRACVFEEENLRRQDGRDDMPPCPLWIMQHGIPYPASAVSILKRIPQYAGLWDQPNLAETWRWEDRP